MICHDAAEILQQLAKDCFRQTAPIAKTTIVYCPFCSEQLADPVEIEFELQDSPVNQKVNK